MQKTFCDICESPDIAPSSLTIKTKKKILDDKTAKIEIFTSFRLCNHSGGFGGPPDLCFDCAEKLIDEIKKEIKKQRKTK